MIIPCEVATKSVIPAIKALMAKELVEKHGLTQEKAAELLGISQSSVSKYTREVRGHVIEAENIKEIRPLVDKMVVLLVSKAYQRRKFLAFFCQTCITVRRTGVMCQFCRRTDKLVEREECDFCLAPSFNKASI